MSICALAGLKPSSSACSRPARLICRVKRRQKMIPKKPPNRTRPCQYASVATDVIVCPDSAMSIQNLPGYEFRMGCFAFTLQTAENDKTPFDFIPNDSHSIE